MDEADGPNYISVFAQRPNGGKHKMKLIDSPNAHEDR